MSASQFTCPQCQQVLRLATALTPGQKVRCPKCLSVFTAPAESALPAASPIQDLPRGPGPVPEPAPRYDREPERRGREDDWDRRPPSRYRDDDRTYGRDRDDDRRRRDDWDDRPRRGGKRSSGLTWVLVLAGIAVVAVVGGLIGLAVFRSKPDTRTPEPLTATTKAMLAHMPANPAIMVGVDLSEAKDRNQVETALAKLPGGFGGMPILGGMGDILNDLEAAVLALNDPNGMAMCAVLRTKKDFDPKVLRQKLGVYVEVPGKNYSRLAGFGVMVLGTPDARTLVLSNLPESEVEALIKPDSSRLNAETRDMLDKAGKAMAWMLIRADGPMRQLFLDEMAKGKKGLMWNRNDQRTYDALARARGVVFWAESGSTVTLNMAYSLSSDKDADLVYSATESSWRRDKKKNAQDMRNQWAALAAGGKADIVNAIVNDTENSLKFYRNGTLVTFSVPLSAGTTQQIAQAIDNDLAPLLALAGGGGFNPKLNPPQVKGHVILNLRDRLDVNDPFDEGRKHCRCKVHLARLEAKRTYQIDMIGDGRWDTYLRLENPQGAELMRDDDSGGGLQARITFTPNQTETYRIIATSCGGQLGAYTLTVQELK